MTVESTKYFTAQGTDVCCYQFLPLVIVANTIVVVYIIFFLALHGPQVPQTWKRAAYHELVSIKGTHGPLLETFRKMKYWLM